jgi:hypothetical protein
VEARTLWRGRAGGGFAKASRSRPWLGAGLLPGQICSMASQVATNPGAPTGNGSRAEWAADAWFECLGTRCIVAGEGGIGYSPLWR